MHDFRAIRFILGAYLNWGTFFFLGLGLSAEYLHPSASLASTEFPFSIDGKSNLAGLISFATKSCFSIQ